MEKRFKEYINEIILHNDTNLKILKKSLSSFFKGKTQKDFDKIKKTELQQLIKLSEIINTKTSLNEADRASLDYTFNYKTPLNYFWRQIDKVKLDETKFIKFRNFLIEKIYFGKDKESFIKWVNWIINEDIDWDDEFYESNDKDFRIEVSITNFKTQKPDVSIIMLGNKKYENIILESLKIWDNKK